MARWEPRTPKESLQASLDRIKKRIVGKQAELKELENQARQVEDALKALK
jgi:predicted  nucleic acid-binding Zn-ribbon protein